MFFFSDGSLGLFEYTQDGAGFSISLGIRIVIACGVDDANDWSGRFFSGDGSLGPVSATGFTTPDQEVWGVAVGYTPVPVPGLTLEDSNYAPIWISEP